MRTPTLSWYRNRRLSHSLILPEGDTRSYLLVFLELADRNEHATATAYEPEFWTNDDASH